VSQLPSGPPGPRAAPTVAGNDLYTVLLIVAAGLLLVGIVVVGVWTGLYYGFSLFGGS
jgi:hypothetical protein